MRTLTHTQLSEHAHTLCELYAPRADACAFRARCLRSGVKEVLGFGELSAYEKGWFDKMMPELKGQIKKGIDFANQ